MCQIYSEVISRNKEIIRETSREISRLRSSLEKFKREIAESRRWLDALRAECYELSKRERANSDPQDGID